MGEFEYFISVERAVKISSNHPPNLDVENVSLTNILNRTLAKSVSSLITDPPFDNSSMDGFAVIYSDTINITPLNPLI